MTDAPTDRPRPVDLAADPRTLDRDALVALADGLRAEVERQRGTIARQGAAIAELQRRAASSAAANAGEGSGVDAAPNGGVPPRRRAARAVPGYDFTLVFDGGSLGNPGKGYGSYQIVDGREVVARDTLDFGDGVTNNQAEFRTLIAALDALQRRLGADAARSSVAIRGDSQLVVNTVTGAWKARHPDLQPLHRQAVALLAGFARADVAWQRREASVRVLGH